MIKPLYVINAGGEKEFFSFEKVYQSAKRAGASASLAQKIAEIIKKEAFPGIKTFDIYKKVRKLLSKESPKSALKFSLRKGMQKLGPTGFPFEKYIAAIFKKQGFVVKINQYLPGFCIRSYEIDFLAQRDNLIYIGECKYRNLYGDRVHSKDALANYARFLDIQKGSYFKSDPAPFGNHKRCGIKTIMVTNTKFTNRAIDYSRCANIELLGWKYPENKGLERLIEEQKLYPITILPSLKGELKDIFVSKKMMLASDVLKIDSQRFVKKYKIPIEKLNSLIREAKILLEK